MNIFMQLITRPNKFAIVHAKTKREKRAENSHRIGQELFIPFNKCFVNSSMIKKSCVLGRINSKLFKQIQRRLFIFSLVKLETTPVNRFFYMSIKPPTPEHTLAIYSLTNPP